MTDVVRTFRRAFALIDQPLQRKLVEIALVSVLVSLLDLLAIVLLVPFLSYLGSSTTAAGPAVDFVESLIGTGSEERAVVILAITATSLFVLRGVGSVILLWVQNGVLIDAQLRLAGRLLRDFTRAPWLVQQASGTGGMIRTARDSTNGLTTLVGSGVSAAGELAIFGSVFAALVIVNPLLALGALLYLAVGGYAYLRLVRRPVERRGQAIQTEGARTNAVLIELIAGVRDLLIRGTVDAYVQQYLTALRGYQMANRLIVVTNFAIRHLLEILMIAGAALVILIATLSGSTSVLVSIGVLLAGGLRLVPSLNMFLVNVNGIRAYEPAVSVVEAELARLGDVPDPPADSSVDGGPGFPTGSFSFREVSFRYPTREDNALEAITLDVGGGEAIGIVGSSGSGKSTLIDILLGFLEPDEGEVTIDEEVLGRHLRAWRDQIGFVPQEIFLVDDTLAANIAFGEGPGLIDHERIDEAIRLAQLRDVVEELAHGTDTMLGERGVMLSGGQRQRVGLARALYHRPRVLILDEATSALDNETERQISEALRSLHGELTMVIIAHRLSTVRSCDRIVYLEEGRISGIGTFDELNRINPGFARLVELGSLEGAF